MKAFFVGVLLFSSFSAFAAVENPQSVHQVRVFSCSLPERSDGILHIDVYADLTDETKWTMIATMKERGIEISFLGQATAKKDISNKELELTMQVNPDDFRLILKIATDDSGAITAHLTNTAKKPEVSSPANCSISFGSTGI